MVSILTSSHFLEEGGINIWVGFVAIGAVGAGRSDDDPPNLRLQLLFQLLQTTWEKKQKTSITSIFEVVLKHHYNYFQEIFFTVFINTISNDVGKTREYHYKDV